METTRIDGGGTAGKTASEPIDEWIEALDAQLRNAADLTGIAVVTTSNPTVDEAAYASGAGLSPCCRPNVPIHESPDRLSLFGPKR